MFQSFLKSSVKVLLLQAWAGLLENVKKEALYSPLWLRKFKNKTALFFFKYPVSLQFCNIHALLGNKSCKLRNQIKQLTTFSSIVLIIFLFMTTPNVTSSFLSPPVRELANIFNQIRHRLSINWTCIMLWYWPITLSRTNFDVMKPISWYCASEIWSWSK